MSTGVVAALAFAIAWLPMFVFRAEAITAALPQYHGSERLWVRLTPLLLTLHISLGCHTMAMAMPTPAGLFAGTVVMGLSLGLWFWGRRQIGPLRQTRLPDEAPLQLRRDGAFGMVRHPLYTSYLMAASVPLLVTRRWYLVLTLLPCLYAIGTRARHEERRLRQQLGQAYDDYCRDVKRLLPYLW